MYMPVCLCVYLCVFVCLCVYVFTCICVYACMCICVCCVCAYMCVSLYVCVYLYICVCMFLCGSVCVRFLVVTTSQRSWIWFSHFTGGTGAWAWTRSLRGTITPGHPLMAPPLFRNRLEPLEAERWVQKPTGDSITHGKDQTIGPSRSLTWTCCQAPTTSGIQGSASTPSLLFHPQSALHVQTQNFLARLRRMKQTIRYRISR